MKLTRTILGIGTLLVVGSLAALPAYAKNLTATKTDLVHWTAISTNLTDGNGLNIFTDPDAKNFPNRFYRAVTP